MSKISEINTVVILGGLGTRLAEKLKKNPNQW